MTQIFETPTDFEAVFETLFAEIEASNPDGLDSLVDSQMIILFRVHEPEVDLWIDGRRKPVVASFDDLGTRPTLTAELTGDTLHELLLGTLPLSKAMWRSRLKVKGSKLRAMKLEGLLHTCQGAYPEIADRHMTANGEES
jgi:putative sterol carrier protein